MHKHFQQNDATNRIQNIYVGYLCVNAQIIISCMAKQYYVNDKIERKNEYK